MMVGLSQRVVDIEGVNLIGFHTKRENIFRRIFFPKVYCIEIIKKTTTITMFYFGDKAKATRDADFEILKVAFKEMKLKSTKNIEIKQNCLADPCALLL